MTERQSYAEFLAAKKPPSASCGFDVEPDAINPILKPHQHDMVRWAVHRGRAGIFASYGLGKTLVQIETLRLLRERSQGNALVVIPLGVRQEFRRDAALLGIEPKFIRRIEEVDADHWLYLTNYETVRDGKLDPRTFAAVSLDEAAVLRGFGGTKTFRQMMALFEGSGTFRFVATATPSPNAFIELLAYAAFLDVMDVGQAKTRFFQRNSEKADDLTLRPHKESEFWHWVATWALFLEKPSDLGYSDEGYELPPLNVCWHEVPSDQSKAGAERTGQMRMFRNAALGVSESAAEKRDGLPARIEKMKELRGEDPLAHRIIWHDLEAEREAIAKAAPNAVAIYGRQDLDDRERAIIGFSDGEIAELAGKPVMIGCGVNLQRHCHWAIYLGIGHKFHDFIQSVHRLHRFLQTHPVRIDLIYSEAEREIRRNLEAKWKRHDELTAQMSAIVREYGLTDMALSAGLSRSAEVTRQEASGEGWRAINNDCIDETENLDENSVDLIVTSIPFATQYEYTPSYRDFGHTDDNDHFWRQMDYLSPNLLRVLKPGRVMAIHCKDRIIPGGLSGLGFQTVHPFSDETIAHFVRHGFAFLARKTIATDVVRENNQTYRLGWSEQCKDGSRMGCGMPEYILLFRKPPTDRSNGYADEPVKKDKPFCDDHGEPAPFDPKTNWRHPVPSTGYSRARWQLDAHGFSRSSGDRLLSLDELRSMPHDELYKWWRAHSQGSVYSFDEHLKVSEELDHMHRLPATFMLFPPHSAHPDVWSDVARMRTMNMLQAARGREMHLCPLQFDIVDRLIIQFSMKGETVFDPFAGLMTVPYCALKLGRRGLGIELSPTYWADGVGYLRAAENQLAVPSLLDLMGVPVEAAEAAE